MKAKIYLLIILWNITLYSFKSYAQSPVVIYDDAIGAGLTFNSWPGTGGSIAESTLSPNSGTKDIEWVVSTKNTHLGLDFWPVKDLSTHTSNNYVLEFYFKSASVLYASKMNLKCKFIDYISGAAAQWENVYTLTPTQLICDGFWHRVSVPLSSFQDVGTWKGSTFYPAGNFVWNAINRLRFMTDQNTELQGATIYFDEIKIIPAAVATSATDYFRTQRSGNWNSVDIWESSFNNLSWIAATSAPTSAAASVNILNSHSIVMESNQSIANLTLNTGSVLSVNPNKQLTINSTFINNGTLNLFSDATGTATILTPVSIGGSGTANIQQYLPSGRNSYITSPVNSATTSSLSSTSSVVSYDEATATWIPESTALIPGKGYISVNNTTSGVVTFSGVLNNGDVSISATRHTGVTKEGFNLVGNPYPSFVNWNTAIKTNLVTTMWYRTKSATSYVFDTYNSSGGVGTSLGLTTISNLIPPMQAFWVRVSSGQSSGMLNFTNTMRSHADVTTNIFKAPTSENTTQQLLRLQVSNGINKDEAVVYFNENAQNLLDEFDSQKMFNNVTNIPEIYTVLDENNLVINGMTELKYDSEIPLGFSTLEANRFNIRVSEFKNFDTNTRIILKDNDSKTEQDLTNGTIYNFESGVTNASNRFSLIFRTVDRTTDVNNINKPRAWAYVNTQNRITIVAPEKSSYAVYNTLGQKQCENTIGASVVNIDKVFGHGVYFVELLVDCKREVIKVVIR